MPDRQPCKAEEPARDCATRAVNRKAGDGID